MIDPKRPEVQVPGLEATLIARTTSHLRASHRLEASLMQSAVDRLTATIGWPGFVGLLSLAIVLWIASNLAVNWLGFIPLDPPPFVWLQGGTAIAAMLMVALILTSQRREDQLADDRAQLILELSISNDQKIAKIIQLLEESRRDNPAITDRIDDQAAAMATPADTDAVLSAIKELREETL